MHTVYPLPAADCLPPIFCVVCALPPPPPSPYCPPGLAGLAGLAGSVLALYSEPVFIGYAVFLVAAITLLFVGLAYVRRRAKAGRPVARQAIFEGVAYPAIAGTCGAQSVLFAKSAMTAIRLSFSGRNQMKRCVHSTRERGEGELARPPLCECMCWRVSSVRPCARPAPRGVRASAPLPPAAREGCTSCRATRACAPAVGVVSPIRFAAPSPSVPPSPPPQKKTLTLQV